ncbi:hypothetical protein [Paenibacillus sp. P22]|uniref:hypothetical protein n=1 Tax=Paenibacillus sp. P22 TaxID=483908 RepID=UPI0004322791|nr:hypothetical protein [Paenibacillus sp. P22]CDN42673.1 hypothetical protein BN871_BS_00300 [Paenibacillus sp. P22]
MLAGMRFLMFCLSGPLSGMLHEAVPGICIGPLFRHASRVSDRCSGMLEKLRLLDSSKFHQGMAVEAAEGCEDVQELQFGLNLARRVRSSRREAEPACAYRCA